ncbi:hypothetical protein [Bullifex porci]|uniref:hypothetical protein n=1 Tax=Bullifex porci TaxID=2606638 RepID=UPI0023F1E3A2|nr:hypothetical protein [Bullifex porci]MDD7255513.1 hypothetical protein [Bullifex porci]MDY2740266.1 hypothetical protein [Bullifex porci]
MYNHYPEQTRRNVVAAHRAGITVTNLSRALNIPRSSIHTWEKSKIYADVAPADATLLSHLNINALLPAKVKNKTNSFVKVVNEEPKSGEVALVIKKGSLSVEINKLMNSSDLITIIKAIGECNVL